MILDFVRFRSTQDKQNSFEHRAMDQMTETGFPKFFKLLIGYLDYSDYENDFKKNPTSLFSKMRKCAIAAILPERTISPATCQIVLKAKLAKLKAQNA